MKHVGKMKNNSAKVVIAYRTLPGDPHSALVVGTQGLSDSHHDSLMTLVEGDTGQTANELAEVLAVRIFPDGSNMLAFLHNRGHLKKVATSSVLMTPSSQVSLPLNELNELIAKDKGISIEELALNDGSKKTETVPKAEKLVSVVEEKKLSPVEMRSKADALYKEAAALRKTADELDPPKKKAKAEKDSVE
jgi:hypothetical protein